MGVYIKGMEMPKSCAGCFLRVGQCSKRIYMENRPSDCPLTEVPEPHGELIDRHEAHLRFGKLAETLEEKNGYEAGAPYAMAALFLNNVEEFPTIIPASEEGET